jgi:hypothetical protein
VEERGDLDRNVFEAGRQADLNEPAANVPSPGAGGEEPVAIRASLRGATCSATASSRPRSWTDCCITP